MCFAGTRSSDWNHIVWLEPNILSEMGMSGLYQIECLEPDSIEGTRLIVNDLSLTQGIWGISNMSMFSKKNNCVL